MSCFFSWSLVIPRDQRGYQVELPRELVLVFVVLVQDFYVSYYAVMCHPVYLDPIIGQRYMVGQKNCLCITIKQKCWITVQNIQDVWCFFSLVMIWFGVWFWYENTGSRWVVTALISIIRASYTRAMSSLYFERKCHNIEEKQSKGVKNEGRSTLTQVKGWFWT